MILLVRKVFGVYFVYFVFCFCYCFSIFRCILIRFILSFRLYCCLLLVFDSLRRLLLSIVLFIFFVNFLNECVFIFFLSIILYLILFCWLYLYKFIEDMIVICLFI